ncbi:MAG: tyrosine-type recombinase/integrase [Victivallaceae bacterium]|nr:tyrosine-type recombinase/integrase [Victivallaceae bacterium]
MTSKKEKQSLKLSIGTIYQKEPGGTFYFRYQLNGYRKAISLKTDNLAQAKLEAEKLIPIASANSAEIVAAHVSVAKGWASEEKNLLLSDAWDHYSRHPERATPATVSEQNSYQATFNAFLDFLNDPSLRVRDITADHAERFALALRDTHLAVDTHNRKIKRLRKIFSTLTEYRADTNPFSSPTLFRKEREEQELATRRLAFTREQEQAIFRVLDDNKYKVINKPEIKVIYHLGAFTGQRLKDCVLLNWNSVDLQKRKIWVRQFKTGKAVTIPIAEQLYAVLLQALKWKIDNYVCPQSARRYKQADRNGKNTGSNLVGIDVLRVIRWIGLEPSVKVEGRKKKVTVYGFHSLRHSFASHCAEAGVPKAVLLSILGTDSDIADKYYTHIGEDAQLRAIQAVSGCAAYSPQERIRLALEHLATMLPSQDREILISILRG